jgi:ATP-dependent DNA ligase
VGTDFCFETHGGTGVRLYTRNAICRSFSRIAEAVAALPAGSCLIDGEAIVTDEAGLAVFETLRSWRHDCAAACSVPST